MDHPDILLKITDWCLSGFSRTQIREMIRCNVSFEDYNTSQCDSLITSAKNLLQENVTDDLKQILGILILRYESIYFYYHSINCVDGMLKSMKAKERLLGLTGGGSKITINNKMKINIKREIKYDIHKLNPDEKAVFEELSLKCSTKPLQPTQILHIAENT